MGLRFQKTIRLPGGFRINLSGKGIGVSAGVPGLRVGIGPTGTRATLSVPGTGLSYVIGSSQRRPEVRAEGSTGPTDEAALPEDRLARLTSLHREAGPRWDWAAIAAMPRPNDPADVPRWGWFHAVAEGVLRGDVEACRAAIDHLGGFGALKALGSSLRVTIEHPWCVEARLVANAEAIVPLETITTTPTGRASRRRMPAMRRAEIYQDYVCSAVYRVAREVFALLPVPAALVHAALTRLDTTSGHDKTVPVLSVLFDRPTFDALDLDRIDPSDALDRFEHRARLRKRTGFAPIEPLRTEDFDPRFE